MSAEQQPVIDIIQHHEALAGAARRAPPPARLSNTDPRRGDHVRVMAIIKATTRSEAGGLPSSELLDDMGRYNSELVKAGVLLAAEGLKASSTGVRIKFDPNKPPKILDGPFAETKELVAGFWLLDVRSMDEAIEWIQRVPNTDGVHHEIEIRPIIEAEDFGERFTPGMREAEESLRDRTGGDLRTEDA